MYYSPFKEYLDIDYYYKVSLKQLKKTLKNMKYYLKLKTQFTTLLPRLITKNLKWKQNEKLHCFYQD